MNESEPRETGWIISGRHQNAAQRELGKVYRHELGREPDLARSSIGVVEVTRVESVLTSLLAQLEYATGRRPCHICGAVAAACAPVCSRGRGEWSPAEGWTGARGVLERARDWMENNGPVGSGGRVDPCADAERREILTAIQKLLDLA